MEVKGKLQHYLMFCFSCKKEGQYIEYQNKCLFYPKRPNSYSQFNNDLASWYTPEKNPKLLYPAIKNVTMDKGKIAIIFLSIPNVASLSVIAAGVFWTAQQMDKITDKTHHMLLQLDGVYSAA